MQGDVEDKLIEAEEVVGLGKVVLQGWISRRCVDCIQARQRARSRSPKAQ
jgi:hypothetical protein